jgi:hypothetical protein
MTFRTVVQARTEKATALPIGEDVLAVLGPAKRPRLRVTINGHSYSARVGIMRGEHLIPLCPEARAAAGVAAGDEVDVDVELDEHA